MRSKYKTEYQEVIFNNRWSRRKYQRNGDWVIIGISRAFFSPKEFELSINFFGFDIRIFFEKVLR